MYFSTSLHRVRLLVAGFLMFSAVCSTGQLQAQGGQMGETVLAVAAAPADAPKKRGPNHPWIELTNLKKGSDGPFPTLEVDYNITQGEGIGMFSLVVKSENGRGGASIHTFGRKQGTISLRSFGFRTFPDNIEVWAEADAGFGPFTDKAGYKVSKSLSLGAVGQLTYAREWRPEEQKAYELAEKAKAPPPPAPAGFVMVDAKTQPLLPGMPVLATWMAEWEDAELINVAEHQLTVKWSKEVAGRPALSTMLRPRTAVASEILSQGKTKPSQFQPSVKTLPSGTLALDENLVPLTDAIEVLPGTPLKAEWAGKWETVTVTGKKRGDAIPINWDMQKAWNEDRKIAMLAIENSVIERLKQPDAKEFYAARLEEADVPKVRASGPVKNYPISLALPRNTAKLKDDLFVPEGTKLGAVWGNKWYELTVLNDSEEGPVECHWENFGGNWNELIDRNSLAISKADESKLRAAAKKRDAEESEEEEKSAIGKVTPQSTKGPAAPAAPAKAGEFEVILDSVGSSKVRVAKVVMEITKLELKDALELAAELPIPLKSGLSRSEADALLKKIEAAGGKGTVQAAEK